MTRLWLVARHEYARRVLCRSFLGAVLFVPLVIVVAVIVDAVRSRGTTEVAPLGVVDPGGALAARELPPELRRFPSEGAAQAALESSEVDGYASLPPDYPESIEVGLTHVRAPAASALRALRDELRASLLASAGAGGDPQLVFRTPDGAREYSGAVTGGMVLPPLSGLLLLMLIFLGSGPLTNAVVEEKANRTLELLATTLPPSHLLAGKILGIAAATLTLLIAWLVAAAGAAAAGGLAFGAAWLRDLRPDPLAMLLVVALVVPAYLLVAAGLTAAGAALSEARAGQQVTMVLMATLMGTVSLTMPLMEDPRSPLAVALSLTPIFSTVLLPARNLFMALPTWQVVAAISLQLVCAGGAVLLAGRALRMGASRFTSGVDWREILGLPRRPGRHEPVRVEQRSTGSSSGGWQWKTWLVAKHEVWTTLTRPLFVGLTFGLPLLLALQMMLFDAARPRESEELPDALPATAAVEHDIGYAGVFGYVDPAGFIRSLPEDVSAEHLRAFRDEQAAALALTAGEVIAYALVPPDYAERGELVVVRADASPLLGRSAAGPLPWVLLVNTLGGDEQLAARVRQPLEWVARPLAAPGQPASGPAQDDAGDDSDRVVAMLSMLLLYAIVLLASGLLMRSVSDEKKNRTMELLLVSISPRQMLSGKIVGLGFVGLVQAAIWTTCLVGGLLLSGEMSSLPAGFAVGPAIAIWGVLLFLFGYGVYAGLMASAGALVPDIDQARGVSFLLVVPALIGFVAAELQLDAPHGAVMTGLSLFPFTAPFVMMLRLAVGGVPTWQLPLTLLIMAATSVVIVRASARMFRAQHLLSGQPFSFRRYFAALRDAG